MPRKVVPVSVVVKYLKKTLDDAPGLHGVMVEGEISNLRKPSSGNYFFSLKDDTASISCVMFRTYASSLSFPIKSGDKVILTGDVTVYVDEGRMQIKVYDMKPSGIGDLYLQLEALKKKLSQEGLFDPNHKKPIPSFATNIALVTGNNTAAREDVLITFQKRWPIATIHEYHAPVQGANAAPKIIEALKKADQNHHDVIILARGGGSLEDLWCFNDEQLARTVYDLKTPIVTGIGHEIDTTLVDYVSDMRANTPTGAVQAAVPDIHEVQLIFNRYRERMITAMQKSIETKRIQYDRMTSSAILKRPELLLHDKMIRLDTLRQKLNSFQDVPVAYRRKFQDLFQRLNASLYISSNTLQKSLNEQKAELIHLVQDRIRNEQINTKQHDEKLIHNIHQILNKKQQAYMHQVDLLDAYSPLKILQRGYSITSHNGKVINSVNTISKGDVVQIRLDDGSLQATVEEINHE